MAKGVFTLGRVDTGATNNAFGDWPVADNFRRSTSTGAAGTAGIVISSKPGRVYRLIAQNSAATAYFLQIHDKATAPVNTEVPIFVKRLPSSGEVEIDLTNINGMPVQNGISIAISSTAGTLTLAVANDLAFRTVIYTAQN